MCELIVLNVQQRTNGKARLEMMQNFSIDRMVQLILLDLMFSSLENECVRQNCMK